MKVTVKPSRSPVLDRDRDAKFWKRDFFGPAGRIEYDNPKCLGVLFIYFSPPHTVLSCAPARIWITSDIRFRCECLFCLILAALALFLPKLIRKHPYSSLPRINTFPTTHGGECQYKRWVDTSKSNINIAGTLYKAEDESKRLYSPRLSLPAQGHKILHLSPRESFPFHDDVIPHLLFSGSERLSSGSCCEVRSMPRSPDQWITWTHIHRST